MNFVVVLHVTFILCFPELVLWSYNFSQSNNFFLVWDQKFAIEFQLFDQKLKSPVVVIDWLKFIKFLFLFSV